MPDLQPSTPPDAPMPAGIDPAMLEEEFGFALGCECADPALQIERWMYEAREAGRDRLRLRVVRRARHLQTRPCAPAAELASIRPG